MAGLSLIEDGRSSTRSPSFSHQRMAPLDSLFLAMAPAAVMR